MAEVAKLPFTSQYASTNSFGKVTVRHRGSRAGAAVFASLPPEVFTIDGQRDFAKPSQPTDGQRDLIDAWLRD